MADKISTIKILARFEYNGRNGACSRVVDASTALRETNRVPATEAKCSSQPTIDPSLFRR
jgi:hypothetical protein